MYRLARLSLRHSTVVLLLTGALTAFLGLEATRLETDAGFRSYLGADHPAVVRLDDFISRFGGGLPAAIVWSCRPPVCSSVFDEASLEMAATLAETLSRLPGVLRVEGPAFTPLMIPTHDGIAVRRFIENGAIASDRDSLVARALHDPLWEGRIVSSDATVGALVVHLASSDSQTNSVVVEAMRDRAEALRGQGLVVHLVGDPVNFILAAEDLEADARRLVPAMMVLILLVVYALFRSFRYALIILASVVIPLIWTFGTAGLLGWSRTAISQALGPFILVIGVCDGIHLVARLSRSGDSTHGRSGRCQRVEQACREVAVPCLFTSATTAGGFLSFTTAGIEGFSRFGVLAALGVSYALVASFSLLPILLAAGPPSGGREGHPELWERILEALLVATRRRARIVLGAGAAAVTLSAVGMKQLRIDADPFEVFGEDSEISRGIRFAEANLSGVGALEIEVRSGEGSLFSDKHFRERIRSVTTHLPRIDEIDSARSVLDAMDHVGDLLAGSDAPSRAEEAELLLVLSLSDAAGLDRWMSLDGKRVRIAADARQVSASVSERILADVEASLDRILSTGDTYTITGAYAVQYALFTEAQRAQLWSFGVAWVVIALLLGVCLRSLRLALLGMLPTTLPVLSTLGAMGLWGISLDIGTAMVGAVILGIAVDDAVHLLSVYRSERARGLERPAAIESAVHHVGRAVVTTSITLFLGFLTMTTSSWESVANFGLLSGIAILVALAADLVLLPALILFWADRRHSVTTLMPL